MMNLQRHWPNTEKALLTQGIDLNQEFDASQVVKDKEKALQVARTVWPPIRRIMDTVKLFTGAKGDRMITTFQLIIDELLKEQ